MQSYIPTRLHRQKQGFEGAFLFSEVYAYFHTMKTVLIFGLAILFLGSCQNTQQQDNHQTDTSYDSLSGAPLVGDGKDAHGCLTSSGETWSQLRNSCVQVFNIAVRLNPVTAREGSAQFSAFALFQEDDSARVELFLPVGEAQSELIERSPNGHFKSGSYELKMTRPITLFVDGKERYRQDAD